MKVKKKSLLDEIKFSDEKEEMQNLVGVEC